MTIKWYTNFRKKKNMFDFTKKQIEEYIYLNKKISFMSKNNNFINGVKIIKKKTNSR